jgi:hypothetical protein
MVPGMRGDGYDKPLLGYYLLPALFDFVGKVSQFAEQYEFGGNARWDCQDAN